MFGSLCSAGGWAARILLNLDLLPRRQQTRRINYLWQHGGGSGVGRGVMGGRGWLSRRRVEMGVTGWSIWVSRTEFQTCLSFFVDVKTFFSPFWNSLKCTWSRYCGFQGHNVQFHSFQLLRPLIQSSTWSFCNVWKRLNFWTCVFFCFSFQFDVYFPFSVSVAKKNESSSLPNKIYREFVAISLSLQFSSHWLQCKRISSDAWLWKSNISHLWLPVIVIFLLLPGRQ